MNMKQLIANATNGTLSSAELAHVVECVKSNTCYQYDGLLVIGRAGARQYRTLDESFLYASDLMLARLALLILCRYWRLSSEYRTVLAMFIREATSNDEGDVGMLAMAIAGTLLATEKDDALLSLLIEKFRDQSEPEPQMLREVAYCALGEAAGKLPQELPPASRHFDLEHGLDPDVLEFVAAAERRLASKDPANGTKP